MQARLAKVPLLVVLIGATGLLMLVPSLKAVADQQAHVARGFFYSALMFILLAMFLALALGARKDVRRGGNQGLFSLLATLYLVLPAVMAVPLAETLAQLRFVDAWFEMISSFTTTGGTVIDLPRRVPEAVHLWRGMAGWLGGLFILSAATALLAPLGLGGLELIRRDLGAIPRSGLGMAGPGVRLQAHAAVVLPAYAGLTLALWVVLTLAGVPGFEALMQAMATLSTSGILPRETLGGIGLIAEIAIFVCLIIALSRRFLPGHGGLSLIHISEPTRPY